MSLLTPLIHNHNLASLGISIFPDFATSGTSHNTIVLKDSNGTIISFTQDGIKSQTISKNYLRNLYISGTPFVDDNLPSFFWIFVSQGEPIGWIRNDRITNTPTLIFSGRISGDLVLYQSLTLPDQFEDELDYKDWDRVCSRIRKGFGSEYPIGTEFSVNKTIDNVTYPIVFVARDYDHYQMANSLFTHQLVLETKYVYGSAIAYKSIIFDAQEALYYAEAGLAAGSYCFTVKNQAWYPDDNNVTFYFTLTQDVPAGGQLVISAQYNQSMQNKQMKSYPSVNSTTAIETVVLSSTEIPGAVDLGATDGLTENMNHLHRIVLGSNNYAQSNLRQWLNSEGKVNTYYTAQTKFDRPNRNLIGSDTAYAGFAHGFGDDFLNAVKAAVVPYRTNDVYEVDSLDGTVQAKSTVYNVKDKFFLLSRPEIYGSWDSSSLKDGEQLEFYVGLTNTERIKYDSFGSARVCWLRSPHPSYGYGVRRVNTDGSLSSGDAIVSLGAVVACIIA